MEPSQTVVITGGNSGLGYECGRSILQANAGWHVIIAGRSRERTEAAARRLAAEAANPHVQAMSLDLASQVSIRRFADDLQSSSIPPLHALVANAGVQLVDKTETTEEGIEATFGINHLGHFLLLHQLLPLLKPPGRIVFVSSGTHDPAQKAPLPAPAFQVPNALAFPQAEVGENPRIVGQGRYTTSKLCNVLCAYELDRRLKAGGLSSTARPIDVFAFDPGLMPGTGLARDYSPVLRFFWFIVLPNTVPLLRLVLANVHTPAESGAALARLVLDPTHAGQGGRYFEGVREIRSSVESYDETKAAILWNGSARLVGLPETSPFEAMTSHPEV